MDKRVPAEFLFIPSPRTPVNFSTKQNFFRFRSKRKLTILWLIFHFTHVVDGLVSETDNNTKFNDPFP